MTKSPKLTNEISAKANSTILPITAIMAVAFSMLVVLFSGFSAVTAYAEQTDTINATKIVNASKDKVWNIISNVDNYSDYWPITIVKSINKSNNTVERDVTVPAPPFMDNKAHQIVTIIPGQSKVIENQTQGAVTGLKIISLIQEGRDDENKTKINVVWNLDLSKVPGIGKGFAKDGISNSVGEALDKIANASK